MNTNSCILFADDTTLLFTDMDHYALENKANKYIGYIYSWLCFNKLTLHLDKTSYTTFCLYKPHTFSISLNDLPIKCRNLLVNSNFLVSLLTIDSLGNLILQY